MNIIGLYVYAPATFTTNTRIEPIEGSSIAAGEVMLQPGVYRLAADATIVANSGTNESNYHLVKADGTKGGPPDPPRISFQPYSTKQIIEFFSGAGIPNEV
jgi:hypothetical protein